MSSEDLSSTALLAEQTNAAWTSAYWGIAGVIVNALVVIVAVGIPYLERRRARQEEEAFELSAAETILFAVDAITVAETWLKAEIARGQFDEARYQSHRRLQTARLAALRLMFGQAARNAFYRDLISQAIELLSSAVIIFDNLLVAGDRGDFGDGGTKDQRVTRALRTLSELPERRHLFNKATLAVRAHGNKRMRLFKLLKDHTRASAGKATRVAQGIDS